MNILLLDCSSKKACYGFARDSEILLERQLDGIRNADSLMFEMRKDFSGKGLKFSGIDIVSLSNGPGSFTGLRIGSAIAKGICFSSGAKLIEIVTLDIIANKYKSAGEFAAAVNSGMRTGEFYYAVYRNDCVLERVSGYSMSALDIIKQYKDIVINEKIDFSENFGDVNVIDVSGLSGITSQMKLTLEKVANNEFVDIADAEPFYMQEFSPRLPGVKEN